MQCSSCKSESLVLREYSRTIEDARGRKSIETLHLCPRCRILHVIKSRLTKAMSSAVTRHRAA